MNKTTIALTAVAPTAVPALTDPLADTVAIIDEAISSVLTLTTRGEVTSDLDVFAGMPDDVETTFGTAS